MQSKILESLPKLILPSDDPGEKLKNKPCTTCKDTKLILQIEDLEIVQKSPCPDCSPTPDHFRKLAAL